jgi:TPR repeat protein
VRQASAAGHPEAIYQLGVVLEEDGKMAEAAKEYSLAAERGSLDAMFRMGQLCEQQGEHPTLGRTRDRDGVWIEMTFDSAFLWYKRAAAEGHIAAHTKLGSFYDPASKLAWDEKVRSTQMATPLRVTLYG